VTGGTTVTNGNNNYFSGLATLSPYLDQATLWDAIRAGGYLDDGVTAVPPQGPAAWSTNFAPFRKQIPVLVCPSDPGGASRDVATTQGRTSYAMSVGDTINDNANCTHSYKRNRGLFSYGKFMTMANVRDGTSSTIAMAERAIYASPYAIRGDAAVLTTNFSGADGPATCRGTANPSKAGYYQSSAAVLSSTAVGAGMFWVDGRVAWSGVTMVLPPNSQSCIYQADSKNWGIFSSSSWHPGGVNVVMVDGSVHFVVDTIDAGNPASGQTAKYGDPSPYGIWGGMGSIAGSEAFKNPW